MKDGSHLRVEEGGRGLDNGDGLVEDLGGVDVAGGALNHGGKVESQVLRVHLGCEAEGQGLLLAGGDGDIVAGGSQVAEDNWRVRGTRLAIGSQERATDEQEVDGLGLVVCDGEESLGGMAIDELDTKDLAVREDGRDVDGKLGGHAGVLELLLGHFNLYRRVSRARRT